MKLAPFKAYRAKRENQTRPGSAACVRGDIVEMNVLVPAPATCPASVMCAEVVHNDMDSLSGWALITRFIKSKNSTLLRLW